VAAKQSGFKPATLSCTLRHVQRIINKLNMKPQPEQLIFLIAVLYDALQTIWDNLPEETMTKAVQSFRKRLLTLD